MKKLLLFAAGGLAVLVTGVIVAAVVLGRGRLRSVSLTAGEVTTATGTYEVRLRHGDRDRLYYVHVPPAAATASRPLPLVLALHGGGGHARQMDDLTHFNAVADEGGFLVVYPEGVDRNWNDGRPDSGAKTQKEGVDDVAFIRAVIDDVSSRLKVDPARVFTTGISNGAIMSTRLACEASDKIAAAAVVVGTAPKGFEVWCSPGRPVPYLAFLSMDDPLVPYEGGEITAILNFVKRGKVVSAGDLETFWRSNNGCKVIGPAQALPDRTPADNSVVSRNVNTECRDLADVVFYTLDGAGHTWPGGKQYLSPWLVGTTNRDIDATRIIWEFFAAHPRPQ